MNASSPWLKLFREQRKSEKRREKLTQQEIELAELDIEINYLGLNKPQPKK